LVYKEAGFWGYLLLNAHKLIYPNHQTTKQSTHCLPKYYELPTLPNLPTKNNQYSTMVHPFLIDQKAYLNRVSSSSASSTQTTYEQFKQSTTSTTHLFGSVSPRSSRLSVTSQTSQQDEMDIEMERKMKQERRRGVIGRLF
jgi:hypothetical protein